MSFDDVMGYVTGGASHADRILRITDPDNLTTGITNENTASSKTYWERADGIVSALVYLYEVLGGVNTADDIDIFGGVAISASGVDIDGTLDVGGVATFDSNVTVAQGLAVVGSMLLGGDLVGSGSFTGASDTGILKEVGTATGAGESSDHTKTILETDENFNLFISRGYFTDGVYTDDTYGRIQFIGADQDETFTIFRDGQVVIGYGVVVDGTVEKYGRTLQLAGTATDEVRSIGGSGRRSSGGSASCRLQLVSERWTAGGSSLTNTVGIYMGHSAEYVNFVDSGALEYFKVSSDGTNGTLEVDSIECDTITIEDSSEAGTGIYLDSSAADGYPTIRMSKLETDYMRIIVADDSVYKRETMLFCSDYGFGVVDEDATMTRLPLYARVDGRAGFWIDFGAADSFPPSDGITLGPAPSETRTCVYLTGTVSDKACIKMEDDADGLNYLFMDTGRLLVAANVNDDLGGTVLGAFRIPTVSTGANSCDSAAAKTLVAAAYAAVDGSIVYVYDNADGTGFWVYTDAAAAWTFNELNKGAS